jgi:pimeloyl-ACP methyl ester carboxylesterase
MRLDTETQLERFRIAVELGVIDDTELVVPENHDVVLEGIRLHYLDWPAREGARDIFLLHGGHLTAHTWDLLALQLRPDFRCLALDQRGHGESEWAPDLDYSTAAYVLDAERFVGELGLDDYVLIGMSLGGLNAIEFAAHHSAHLRGLVIVDVGPEIHTEGTARRTFTAPSEEASIDVFVDRAVEFNRLRHPELLRTGVMHNTRRLADGTWTWTHDPRFGRGVKIDFSALAARLPEIRCPTLVVRGSESEVFWREDAERVVARVPDARWVEIDDAGHTVQGDQPRALARELRTFFAEIGA